MKNTKFEYDVIFGGLAIGKNRDCSYEDTG